MGYCVYKHTCPNGKIYIGITSKKPLYRWDNGNGYRNNSHFFNAIIKYGWNNIKHEILFDGLTKEEAFETEKKLIKLYKSNMQDYGYNRSTGGDGGTGIHDEEKIKKIAEKNRGKKRTEEQKERMRMAHNCKMVRGCHPMAKKVIQIKDGCIINVFECAVDAFEITGIYHIKDCCRGERKSAGGYVWKYEVNKNVIV